MFSSRQEPRRISLSFLLVLAGLSGLAVARPASSGALPKPIAFFIYTPGLSGAERGADAVRAQFREFLDRLGPKSDYGSVGIALNYPYTTFVSGTVPANFAVRMSSNSMNSMCAWPRKWKFRSWLASMEDPGPA